MKVIMLDVDGVLNSMRSVLARLGAPITPASIEAREALAALCDGELPEGAEDILETLDPVAVGLVNRLVAVTGCELVLSTSHRAMFVSRERGIAFGGRRHREMLALYFRAMGIEAPIYGMTDVEGPNRGTQVQKWLAARRQQVTHYVALDDAGKTATFLDGQHLVQCDPEVGFSVENYRAACALLGAEG